MTEAQTSLQRSVQGLRRSVMNARLARAHDVAFQDSEKARSLLMDIETCPPQLRGFSWQLALNRSRRQLAHFQAVNGPVLGVALSAGGKRLAALGVGRVCVWDIDRGERQLDLQERIGPKSTVAIDALGRWLLILKDNGNVLLLDVETKQKVPLHNNVAQGHATSIAISSSGRMAAVGDRTGKVRIWDVDDGSETWFIHALSDQPLTGLSFSEDASRLGVIAADGAAQVIDVATGETSLSNPTPSGERWTSHWGPQLRMITAQRHYGGIRISDAQTRLIWKQFERCGPNPLSAIVPSPHQDGKVQRVVVCRRNAVELYDRDHRVAYLETGPTSVHSLAIAADGSAAAVGYGDGTVSVLAIDPRQGRQLPMLQSDVNQLAFSPDSRLMALSGSEKVVQVIRLSDGQVVREFGDRETKVTGLATTDLRR